MTDPIDFHALADGELAPAEAARVKADPQAAAEVDAILNLKDLLATHSVRHHDEEAWRGCLRRLDAIDKTRRVEGFVGRYAWAVCGLMLVFILSGRVAMRNWDGESADGRDFAGVFTHARPVMNDAERNRQKAYRDLLNAVGSSLDPTEIQLVGSQAGRVRDFPAARYFVRDRKGDLTLTQVNGILNLQDTAPLGEGSNLSAGVANGSNLIAWHAHGQTYLLFGDRPLSELGEFASHVLGAH